MGLYESEIVTQDLLFIVLHVCFDCRMLGLARQTSVKVIQFNSFHFVLIKLIHDII